MFMSVYIHIPFCDSICTYCDFCKVVYDKKFVKDYLKNLEREIIQRYNGEKVSTIFIGGGTPTCLEDEELITLFEIIKIFNLCDDYEFTVEGNTENITESKLIIMKKYGVNRISVGVESFDESIIRLLGRSHTKVDVFNVIKLIKKFLTNINIDLMYAISDDMDIVKNDIKSFLALDIPHVSVYSLIIENHTILKIKGFKNISEDIDYEMYKYIESSLEKHGYIHYEISNYAKDGYQSRHNLVYWNNDCYYGFGLSSTSYVDNIRRVNVKNLSKYLSGHYLENEEKEDIGIRMENEVMLGLRKIEGINLRTFKDRYDVNLEDVYDIDDLIEDGYLIKDGDYLKIDRKYLYVSNEIIVRIFN